MWIVVCILDHPRFFTVRRSGVIWHSIVFARWQQHSCRRFRALVACSVRACFFSLSVLCRRDCRLHGQICHRLVPTHRATWPINEPPTTLLHRPPALKLFHHLRDICQRGSKRQMILLLARRITRCHRHLLQFITDTKLLRSQVIYMLTATATCHSESRKSAAAKFFQTKYVWFVSE